MASWKKVIVSGSAISALNNDANYLTSTAQSIVSSSTQLAADISGSGNVRFEALNTETGSLSTRIESLNTQTGSILGTQVIAGTGLTGGGTLAANRTLNVASANNGIVANADNIELATASSTFTDGVKAKLSAEGVISSSAQIEGDFLNTLGDDVLSGSAQIAADISGSFVSASNALGSRIDSISTDFDDITNKPTLISASVLSSPSQGTARLAINGVNTDVDLGLQAGDSPQFTNLTVSGDLTVTGNTFEAQVTNLNVEDRMILLNSGSTGGDVGIIFGGSDPSGDGTNNANTGSGIFWDSPSNVFGFAQDVKQSAVSASVESKIGNIETSNSNPSSAPTFQGTGTTHVNESDESIWIFS